VLDVGIALRVEHLSKTFPGQKALDDISIDVRSSEIHALVGQNGSGKSTFIKILSGFHKADLGAEISVGGESIVLDGTQRQGMRFIHQDLSLVQSLSIRENLGLGVSGQRKLAPINSRKERAIIRHLLSQFGLNIDPDTAVNKLSRFEQSAVEIVRALAAIDTENVHLLVLDEPTASMGAAEVQQLFSAIRRVNAMGIAVLYVSHILSEVLNIADRVSVLRDGQMIAVRDTANITEDQLIELIVGHAVERATPPSPGEIDEGAMLSVRDLSLGNLHNANFTVRRNEVLGITGIAGSGYEEIGPCLAGVGRWDSGTVVVAGISFERFTPASASRAGVVSMPADRLKAGVIPHFTVAENVTLPNLDVCWRYGFLNRKAEMSEVSHWIRVTGVVPPDPNRLVQELSGGNQQKVMLAKALRLNPRVLCLNEPTQGVDVGAAAAIRRLITDLARDDRAVIVCSSDAEELAQVCQRVLVTRNGTIAAELSGQELTEDRIVAECQFEEVAA